MDYVLMVTDIPWPYPHKTSGHRLKSRTLHSTPILAANGARSRLVLRNQAGYKEKEKKMQDFHTLSIVLQAISATGSFMIGVVLLFKEKRFTLTI